MTRNAMAGMTGFAAAFALTLVLAASPVAAADEEAQKACEDKAEKHDPPLSSVDWEVFMADCLADATATTGKEE
jgi:hypothetical protein